MAKTVALNQINVFVRIRMRNLTTNNPATGINAASAGHETSYQRGENTAFVPDAGAAADLALITSAHSDWGFFEIGEGWYRVDYPDAAFLAGVGSVLCTMSTTAEYAESETVTIEPLLKFSGSPDSRTATTTTFPAGTGPLKGDGILVQAGTGDPGNIVLISSATGEVATHAAFSTAISETTSTIAIIAGDAVTADGGINVDVASSTLSTITPAQVNAECDTAITDALLAKAAQLPLVLTLQGNIKGSMEEVAQDVEVQSGTDSPITKTDV